MAARVDSFMIAGLLELDQASPGELPPGFLVGLILKNTPESRQKEDLFSEKTRSKMTALCRPL